jgi:hypothetical protein
MQKPRAEIWVALAVAAVLALFGLGVLSVLASYTAALPPLPTLLQPGMLSPAPAGSRLTQTFLPYGTLPAGPSPLPTRLVVAPAATEAQPSAGTPVPTPPPFATASPAGRFSIGQSVQGRDVVVYALPGPASAGRALVFVSGIHGDEVNAWPVLQSILDDLGNGALVQPPGLALYFVESLNPDGTFFETRLNRNMVDLNRNWDTYDWRSRVQVSPLDFLPAGGGPEPFSEPETRAMRDWLLTLQTQHESGLTVIYFHAAVPPDGLVIPGTHFINGRDLADTPSREVGQLLAQVAGYEYSNQWVGGYTVTGDATTWAVARGMLSITVELPVREPLDAPAAQNLRRGILAVVDFLSR